MWTNLFDTDSDAAEYFGDYLAISKHLIYALYYPTGDYDRCLCLALANFHLRAIYS